MQRKNSILKTRSNKSGFAMIMAIMVLVVIATILALSLSLTTTGVKRTTQLYLYEQAAILSHSAAEYAMLRISQANPCSIDTLNFTYNTIYNISVDMLYLSTAGSPCEGNATADGTYLPGLTHAPSNGTVILDIAVDVNDTTVTTEPIRYFRRTIQKL